MKFIEFSLKFFILFCLLILNLCLSTDKKFSVKKIFPHARTHLKKSKDQNHIYIFPSPLEAFGPKIRFVLGPIPKVDDDDDDVYKKIYSFYSNEIIFSRTPRILRLAHMRFSFQFNSKTIDLKRK